MVVVLSFSVVVLAVVVALAIAAASSAPRLTQHSDDLPKIATQPRLASVASHNPGKPVALGQAHVTSQAQSNLGVPTTTFVSPPLIFAAGLQ
jgi:hypothetical protein